MNLNQGIYAKERTVKLIDFWWFLAKITQTFLSFRSFWTESYWHSILMKNDDTENLAQRQEEIELLKLVYPDLVKVFEDGRIQVKLAFGIEVVFRLPPGYPTRSSPEHQISVPASLSEVRQQISQKLKENYDIYAGQQLLTVCIAEINSIANNCQQTQSNDSGISEDSAEERPKRKLIEQKLPEKRYNWFSGSILEDRKSTFQAHLIRIGSKDEAMEALDQLKENNKIARATHNIYAFTVNSRNGHEHADCYDDGEKGAGPKLFQLLKMMKIENTMIVVSRWYGGIHLGPDRFRNICNVAREVVLQCRESN